ncbi:MAG: LysM peptidoglycan-binding domain-containing protein [Planctomycetes bacterium]|nr:LysM peptidoglycan-binding domain-containing protein [Planctomycetota bacterium]
MSRLRKIFIVISVLGVGICAAIPFYRNGDTTSSASKQSLGAEVPWRGNGNVRLQVKSANADRSEAAQLSDHGARAGADVVKTPAPAIDVKLAPVSEPGKGGSMDQPQPDVNKTRSDSHLVPEIRITHIVEDGDTLADLAEHYLGDPARYLEIFRANPQLQSPTELPINMKLEIPIGLENGSQPGENE